MHLLGITLLFDRTCENDFSMKPANGATVHIHGFDVYLAATLARTQAVSR